MHYLLIDEQRRQNAINHILKLPEGDKWEVVIREYKKKRTISQNNLMWMWLPYLADHFGYTVDQMHEELKYAFIGEEAWTNRKGISRVRPISTTTLKVKEMAEYLTKIEVLAGSFDIKLPTPHDREFALMIDSENETVTLIEE